MNVNKEAERRAMLVGRLLGTGVCGFYGLLKNKGARSGDGWVVDGLAYLIEEILADEAGVVERVLFSGPSKMPFWLNPGRYSFVGSAHPIAPWGVANALRGILLRKQLAGANGVRGGSGNHYDLCRAKLLI